VRQVHVRVHKALEGNVMVASGRLRKRVAPTLRRQRERVVGALRIGGRDLVAGAVGVIIGGGEGADITEADVLAGDPFVERSAPVTRRWSGNKPVNRSLLAQPASGLRESGRRRLDRDGASQAVSAKADRRDAGEHGHLRGLGRGQHS
jgi:hypothetical protein